MTFSSKLQKLRKDSNLSQEQLASELRVSRQAISKWELGTLPDINNLVKISNFFDCSLDYLMTDNEDKSEKKCTNNDKNQPEKNTKHKSFTHKKTLKFLLPVFGMTISIISLIILKLLSMIYPAPITRQAEDGTWYADFIGYVDYHNLYGVLNLQFIIFMISFTALIFVLFVKKSKPRKRMLSVLIGYIMIMSFSIITLYELNTKSFVIMNLPEIIVSIIYIACATFLLFLGNEKIFVNIRR